MKTEMIVVFAGIGLFLLAGVLGGLGIYSLLKSQKKPAFLYFSIGFALIIAYIIMLFGIL